MRNTGILINEYYHIYNRGNNKQNIFLDTRDYARFLFLIIYFQSPLTFLNISRNIDSYIKKRAFGITNESVSDVVSNRSVELVSFCLMPNHFHLIVKEVEEGGISKYMHRVSTSFTKYHNKRYKKVGHLFQGVFKAVHIKDDNQLCYLSAYIHRNPREIKIWKDKESRYPWSSFGDYLKDDKREGLLEYEIIKDQFSNSEEYKDFVDKSGAKDLDDEDI